MMPLINANISITAVDVSCVLISTPGVDNDDALRIIINTAFSTGHSVGNSALMCSTGGQRQGQRQ